MKRYAKIFLIVFMMIVLSAGLTACSGNYIDSGYGYNKGESSTVGSGDIIVTEDRLLVYYVKLDITVNDIEKDSHKIREKVKDSGGYEESSDLSDASYAKFVFRVPTNNLDSFISSIESEGKVNSKVVRSEDLTDIYVSEKTKLESLKAHKEALEKLLEKATTTEEELKIISEIFSVSEQIDLYENKLSSYKKQSDYSTVTIYLYKKGEVFKTTLAVKISEVFSGSLSSVGVFLETVLLILIAIFPYCILFGVCFAIYVLIKFIICKIRKVPFTLFRLKKNKENKISNNDSYNENK